MSRLRLSNLSPWQRSAARPLLLARDAFEVLRAKAYMHRLPEAARLRLVPDFLGIGAQKAATTWLDAVLRLHPGIGMPLRRKELHYFDTGHWKGLDWYRWHFRQFEHALKGEITPAYSILPVERIQEIRRLNPRLKLILLLRNPVERAWSMAAMDAFRHGMGELSARDVVAARSHVRTAKSIGRSRYTHILENWLSVFGTDQVFIGYYEEVAEAPAALIGRILVFLGVDPGEFDWSSPLLHQRLHSFKRPMPPELRAELCELYRDEIALLHKRLDSPYTAAWLASVAPDTSMVPQRDSHDAL